MSLVEAYVPQEVQLDRELVSAIVQKDEFQFLDGHPNAAIWHDESFMRFVCETLDPFHLEYIPKHSQLLHSHLIVEIVVPRVLHSTLPQDQVDFGMHLASEFWDDFHFVQTWFSHRGPFIKGVIPKPWNLEPDQFLWIAEHCQGSIAKTFFEFAPWEILKNQSLMRNAIEIHPSIYSFAVGDLKNDINLRMVVCSRVGSRQELFEDCGMSTQHLLEIIKHAHDRLHVYLSFQAFLDCMSHKTAATPLMLLNQGQTTTMVYKLLIAEYLGNPTDKEYQQIRQFCNNMKKLR